MNTVPHARRIWLPTETEATRIIELPSVPRWLVGLRSQIVDLNERRATRREWSREDRHAAGDLYLNGTARGTIRGTRHL